VLLLNVRAVAAGPVADVLTPETLRRAYGAVGGLDTEDAEPRWAA
jgi:ABC-type hemin transport system ATPase subunit